jgi:hypothetical protein
VQLRVGPFADSQLPKVELEWHLGFVRGASIDWRSSPIAVADEPELAAVDWNERCARELTSFLALPSAAFVQALAIGPPPGVDVTSYATIVRALERVSPPCLRTLELGAEWDDWAFSQVRGAVPALPQLRSLAVYGGHVDVGAVSFPELREASFIGGSATARDRGDDTAGLGRAQVAALAAAAWPQLERLEIAFGCGTTAGVDQLAPLLDGKRAPKLRHLVLAMCPFSDALVGALARSRLLAQLETLDLRGGNLGDGGVTAMVRARRRFQHLRELLLGDNALTRKVSKPRVEGLAAKVDLGWRQTRTRALR